MQGTKTSEQEKEHVHEKIKQLLTDYLEKHNLRKTQERYSILEMIYSREGHFDADSLYSEMKQNNVKVSRATVYNTLDLLVKAGLIVKHQFRGDHALYEKAYGFYQHDHLICKDCGKILEFCFPAIGEIYKMVEKKFNFAVEKHSLILYGHCQNKNCENKKL